MDNILVTKRGQGEYLSASRNIYKNGILHHYRQNINLDFGLSSRFVADLWSFSVHVHISFVFYLTTKHLGPRFEASLKPHSKDAFDL